MLLLKRFLKLYDKAIEYIVFLLIVVAVLSVAYGILSRMFLILPFFIWTEELSRYSITTMVFIIAGLSIRRGIHLGLDMLPEKLTGISHKILITALNITVIAFLSFIAVTLLVYAPTATRVSPGLNIPLTYLYLIMGLGLLLMVIEVFFITLFKWKEE